MSLPEIPGFVPVVMAVLAMASILQGAYDPRFCGGCHAVPLLGVGGIAGAGGIITGLVLARRR